CRRDLHRNSCGLTVIGMPSETIGSGIKATGLNLRTSALDGLLPITSVANFSRVIGLVNVAALITTIIGTGTNIAISEKSMVAAVAAVMTIDSRFVCRRGL